MPEQVYKWAWSEMEDAILDLADELDDPAVAGRLRSISGASRSALALSFATPPTHPVERGKPRQVGWLSPSGYVHAMGLHDNSDPDQPKGYPGAHSNVTCAERGCRPVYVFDGDLNNKGESK